MSRTSHRSLAAALVAAVLGAAAASAAQTATGQITGSVQDTTGAVMRGQGRRHQPGDRPDPADHHDQRRLRRSAAAGRPLRRDRRADGLQDRAALGRPAERRSDPARRIELEAGNVSETVEVQAGVQALDTGSASVGQTITEKQVTELPLNGRNFIQLLFLGAGAVETGGEQGAMRQGSRQRDQHHGSAADLEQLHDRRHVERGHGARHAGRDPLRRRDPGVQGADDDLFARSTASAPTRSTW